MSFFSIANIPGDGSTNQFSVPFGYLKQADVTVTVNGIADPSITWITSSLIQTSTTPALNVNVQIKRTTDRTILSTIFANGSTPNAVDFNTLNNQLLYISQEILDGLTASLGLNSLLQWDAQSKRITNLADGINNTDAVTVSQINALTSVAVNSASTSVTNALTSEAAAATSAYNAAISETNAETSATNAANSETAVSNSLAAAGLPGSLSGQSENLLKVKVDETGYEFQNVADLNVSGFPKGYLQGPAVSYTSVSTITIPEGLKARSSDDTTDMEVASDLLVDITASGVNGLDTGSEANSTWYYLYVIKDTSTGTVSGLLSTVNEAAVGSITLPNGYTKKRQLPLALRNNGNGDIIEFIVIGCWPGQTKIRYVVSNSRFDTSGSTYTPGEETNIINLGTASSYTPVSAADYIPPISKVGIFHAMVALNFGSFGFRPAGETVLAMDGIGYEPPTFAIFETGTNASQEIEYRRHGGNGALMLDVADYYVTEL